MNNKRLELRKLLMIPARTHEEQEAWRESREPLRPTEVAGWLVAAALLAAGFSGMVG